MYFQVTLQSIIFLWGISENEMHGWCSHVPLFKLPHIVFSSVFLVIPCRYLPDTCQVSQENEYKWLFFCCKHFTSGNAFRAQCSQNKRPSAPPWGGGGGALILVTPHALGITLHVKHRHYFFLCIFRSLPTLNLSCLTSLTLTWDLPLFYEILWNSERPNTTCLEPFELSLLNFERKIQSYD